jgi:sulfur-carrier protein adenylyltransferase/sulfurtransferase
MPGAPQVSVAELRHLRESGAGLVLLDVREPWEIAIASLADSTHIPLNEIPQRWKELDATTTIIVMCKAGGRSQRAADYLLAQGLTHVSNLQGGIDAWTRDIDPGLSGY